jgi:nicotinamide riboside transporter PnuC
MSYLFALAIIIGYLFVISKRRIGFLIQFIGVIGMLYLYWGVDGGVVLVNSVFLIVNIYGWIRWKSCDKEGETQ